MSKKKLVIILSVAAVLMAGICTVIIGRATQKPNPEELLNRFESAVKEVLGDENKRASVTKVATTFTYSKGDEESNIYFHTLKTTYYEAGDPSAVTGLNTDALGALFPVDLMESCEEMMIQDWHGALYKKGDEAYLCWTCDPESSYVLQYNPSTMQDAEVIKMAESVKPIE